MKDLGEIISEDGRKNIIVCGAEGVCENSQAKGPDLDDTLESDRAPKKQFSVSNIN